MIVNISKRFGRWVEGCQALIISDSSRAYAGDTVEPVLRRSEAECTKAKRFGGPLGIVILQKSY